MNIVLETPRLLLKEFDQSDALGFYNMNLDPEVLKYTGNEPFSSVEEAEIFIQNYDHYQKYGYGRWTVLRKEDKAYLGFCGLKYSPSKNEIDLGFRFIKQYWGKGYATEAARASLQIGFEKYQIQTIVGRAMKHNLASHNVLKKLGFEFDYEFEDDGLEWCQYAFKKTKNSPHSTTNR